MNRKDRRKAAKLNRSNSKNNVVSLFGEKPEMLTLDEMSKDIGFDYNKLDVNIAYDIDVYNDEILSYDKESNTFTFKDVGLARLYSTYLECRETAHVFAVLELIKCMSEELKSQRELNIIGCFLFHLHVRHDTNVVINANFNGQPADKDNADTILNYMERAEDMSQEEISDVFESVPWVDNISI